MIPKEEIDNIISVEGLADTYTLITSTHNIASLIVLPILAIIFSFIYESYMLFFIIGLNVFTMLYYPKISRMINDSTNETWATYWEYQSQIFSLRGLPIEEYPKYVKIFWPYRKLMGIAVLISLYIGIVTIIIQRINYFPFIIPIISVAVIGESLFLRDLLLPRVKIMKPKLFMGKIGILQSFKKKASVAIIFATILVNIVIFLDRISLERGLLSMLSFGLHLLIGILIGYAVDNYYRIAFDMAYEPIKHPISDQLIPVIASMFIAIYAPFVCGNSVTTNVIMISFAIFSIVLAYGFFAISLWRTLYTKLTAVTVSSAKSETKKKYVDVYSVDANKFVLMAIISPICLGLIYTLSAYNYGFLEQIIGIHIIHFFGGIGLATGYLIGLYIAHRRITGFLLYRIKEARDNLAKLKRKLERKKSRKEKPKKKEKEKKKINELEKEDFDIWLSDFEKLLESWEVK